MLNPHFEVQSSDPHFQGLSSDPHIEGLKSSDPHIEGLSYVASGGGSEDVQCGASADSKPTSIIACRKFLGPST